MVKFPNIFGQIKGQSFAFDSAFGGELPFKIAPKPFQAVYVVALGPCVFAFAVLDRTVYVTPAHTFPPRQRIPNTSVFVVPRPRFAFVFFWLRPLFFHWPPRYVSSTSTVPLNISAVSSSIALLAASNALRTRFLSIPVSSEILLLLSPNKKKWSTFRHSDLVSRGGRRPGRHSYRHLAQRVLPSLK